MERNHPPDHQNYHQQQVQQLQPYDFFYVPNDHPHLKESSSSSTWVSTELSLSTNYGTTTTTYKKSSSSSSSSNPNIPSSPSKTNNNDGEWGFSTALKLYDDPWKIKKILTTSDLGKLNRLLLLSDLTENLVAPAFITNPRFMHHHHHLNHYYNNLNNNNQHIEEVEESLLVAGKAVRVWDVETRSMHELILKRWASFKNYVFIGDWNQDFVKRRRLRLGDEIGFQWDSYNHCFNFSLLKRAKLAS